MQWNKDYRPVTTHFELYLSNLNCEVEVDVHFLITGGLLAAAQTKQDIRLLAIFEAGDPVAREMVYHRECHKQYIADVTNKFR